MPRVSSDTSCRCGHTHKAHEHYRRGTDCALCVCGRFAREGDVVATRRAPWPARRRPPAPSDSRAVDHG